MSRSLVALGWLLVVAAALGFHPAVRSGAPLYGLSHQIAEDAAQGGAFLKSIGLSGGGASIAFWALDLSLLYIAGWALFRLCPRGSTAPSQVPVPLLTAALVGQVAALFARDATIFYFVTSGVVAVSLFFLEREASGRPVAKFLLSVVVGILFVLIASPLDMGLASLTGAPMLPEIWFPLVVEYSSRVPVAIALSVVVALSLASIGFSRAGWVSLAPACVLVLGPSNPAKGMAAALVVVLLARSGAGPLWRAGFLAVLSAIPLFLV